MEDHFWIYLCVTTGRGEWHEHLLFSFHHNLLQNKIQHDSLWHITFNKQDLKHHCELTSYFKKAVTIISYKINHIFWIQSHSHKEADVIIVHNKQSLRHHFSKLFSKGPSFWSKQKEMFAVVSKCQIQCFMYACLLLGTWSLPKSFMHCRVCESVFWNDFVHLLFLK